MLIVEVEKDLSVLTAWVQQKGDKADYSVNWKQLAKNLNAVDSEAVSKWQQLMLEWKSNTKKKVIKAAIEGHKQQSRNSIVRQRIIRTTFLTPNRSPQTRSPCTRRNWTVAVERDLMREVVAIQRVRLFTNGNTNQQTEQLTILKSSAWMEIHDVYYFMKM